MNKGDKEQYETYYNVIKKSLMLVNTNKKWAGMSSILEVMYYYRPIITSRYDEFIKTFGNDIGFGLYSENNRDEIKTNIETILNLNDEEYNTMSMNANSAVKDFTYDSFVGKIEKMIGPV